MKKNLFYLIWSMAALILSTTVINSTVCAQSVKPVIGVYDSRQVVLAYFSSPAGKEWKKNLDMRSDSAQKAGDTSKLRSLSIEAMSYQHLLHQMCFSTASVSMVLEPYKSKLPELAKKAGVDILVSKYNLNFISPDLKTVDVTAAVVKLFNPPANVEQTLKEIEKTEPVPIQEMLIDEEMLNVYAARYGKK